MPNYCFHCPVCNINFEELCRYEEREEVPCPGCGHKPESVATTPSAILFTNPKGTSKEHNFDYVAQTNYANAQAMRRAAEEANTHGHQYKELDDISKYEGKIADIDPFIKE